MTENFITFVEGNELNSATVNENELFIVWLSPVYLVLKITDEED